MRRAVLLILALCFLTSITSPGFSEKPLRLFFEKNIAVERQPGEEHVVKQGEWLFKILESKGYSASEIQGLLPGIQSLNPHIPDMNRLMPGQVIQIPEISSTAGSVVARPKPTTPPGSYEKMPYVVRSGDTLVQILQAQGVPTKLIFGQYMDLFLKLNPDVPDSNTLRVGQEIILPVTSREERPQAAASPLPPAPKQAQTLKTQPPQPISTATPQPAALQPGTPQRSAPQPASQTASALTSSATQPAPKPPLPQVAPVMSPASSTASGNTGQNDAGNSTAADKMNERTIRTGMPLVKTVLEQMRADATQHVHTMFIVNILHGIGTGQTAHHAQLVIFAYISETP